MEPDPSQLCGGSKRDNGHKLGQEIFMLDTRRNFFTLKTAQQWVRLLERLDFGGFQHPPGQSPEQRRLNSELAQLWAGAHALPSSLNFLWFRDSMKILFPNQNNPYALNKCKSSVCVRFCPRSSTRVKNQTSKDFLFWLYRKKSISYKEYYT